MTYNFSVTDEAQAEALIALNFYDDLSVKLGDRFLLDLDAVYKKISLHPLYYKYLTTRRKNKFRCTRLKSFPFLVIFHVLNNDVVVVSVLHTKRKKKIK